MIISHVRSFMIISHVKIIAFQLLLFCKNYCFSKTVLYIINRKIHGCLEIPDLFLVLNMISHSFAALTHEISCSTLEINLVFPHTRVLFSMYYAQENAPLLAQMWCIFPCIIQINTKFANFAGLYFPHFTTFRNQTLQFY